MQWRATFAAFVITLSSLAVFGAEPASEPVPTTAPATQASTAATTSTSEALQVVSLDQATGRFETALRRAREQYLRDLTELKRRAVKADNFPAANEINALIEQLSGGGGNAVAPPVRLSTVTRALVRADQDWQRSPVLVRAGDTLRITASGEWIVNDRDPQLTTYGPDGLRRDGTADFHGMWSILWAKVGYRVYFVGKGTRFTAENDGVLEFRSNDFSLGDNRGAINVQVTKE